MDAKKKILRMTRLARRQQSTIFFYLKIGGAALLSATLLFLYARSGQSTGATNGRTVTGASTGAQTTMRAYIQEARKSKKKAENGGKHDISVFTLVDDLPVPGPPPPGHILLRVHAAALNPVDHLRAQFFANESPCIVGYDAAGIVEAVASDVTSVRVGDRVFGDVVAPTLGPKKKYVGSTAELVHAPADAVTQIPDGVSFVHAAAVPLVATTAIQTLTHLKTQKGDRVYIPAGAGGVGVHALQIAKALFGAAEVATTASAAKEALVRKHGADKVVDYKQQDAGAKLAGWADVVIDTVGEFDTARKVKKEGSGRVTSIAGTNGDDIVKYLMQPDKKVMETIAGLLKDGKLTPVIDSEFSLADAQKAMEQQASGRASGKIIVKVIG